jgi:hypothetical protein
MVYQDGEYTIAVARNGTILSSVLISDHTDDIPIQAALDILPEGSKIDLAADNFGTTSPIYIIKDYMDVRGQGQGTTITLYSDVSAFVMNDVDRSKLGDLIIQTYNGQTQPVVVLSGANNSEEATFNTIHDILFKNAGLANIGFTCIKVKAGGTSSVIMANTIRDISVHYYCDKVIDWEITDATGWANANVVKDIWAWYPVTAAIDFSNVNSASSFSANKFIDVTTECSAITENVFKNIAGSGNEFRSGTTFDWAQCVAYNHQIYSFTAASSLNLVSTTDGYLGYDYAVSDLGTHNLILNPLLQDTPVNMLTANIANGAEDGTIDGFVAYQGDETVISNTTEFLQGTHSLEIITPGHVAFEGVTLTKVVVEPDTTYTASLSYKGSGTTVLFAGWERTSADAYVGAFTPQATLSTSAGWTRKRFTFTTSGTTGKVELWIQTTAPAVRTLYIDSIKLEKGFAVTEWVSP